MSQQPAPIARRDMDARSPRTLVANAWAQARTTATRLIAPVEEIVRLTDEADVYERQAREAVDTVLDALNGSERAAPSVTRSSYAEHQLRACQAALDGYDSTLKLLAAETARARAILDAYRPRLPADTGTRCEVWAWLAFRTAHALDPTGIGLLPPGERARRFTAEADELHHAINTGLSRDQQELAGWLASDSQLDRPQPRDERTVELDVLREWFSHRATRTGPQAATGPVERYVSVLELEHDRDLVLHNSFYQGLATILRRPSQDLLDALSSEGSWRGIGYDTPIGQALSDLNHAAHDLDLEEHLSSHTDASPHALLDRAQAIAGIDTQTRQVARETGAALRPPYDDWPPHQHATGPGL